MLNSMGMGGIENFLMSLYRSIDREKYQFDFILQSKEEGFFEKEIKELGGNIYKIEVGKDATVMAALLTELQSELQKGIR